MLLSLFALMFRGSFVYRLVPGLASFMVLLSAAASADQPASPDEALRLAAENGQDEVVATLLEHKAGTEARDPKMGWTPLMWAANNRHAKVAQLLVDGGADINAVDIAKQSALLLAIRNSANDIMRLLLEHHADAFLLNKMHNTLLSEAVIVGNSAAVEELLLRGVDVNHANDFGSTPLHAAALSGRASIATLLLRSGANVNARNSVGATPLSLAVHAPVSGRRFMETHDYSKATQTVKVLIASGATVDAEELAFAKENRMTRIVALLK